MFQGFLTLPLLLPGTTDPGEPLLRLTHVAPDDDATIRSVRVGCENSYSMSTVRSILNVKDS